LSVLTESGLSSEQLFAPNSIALAIAEQTAKSKVGDQQDDRISGFADPTVIAAVIAAIASIVSVVLTFAFGWLNQVRLTSLQNESQKRLALMQEQIDIRKKKEDARTTYEYEARKRLYTECEPILFQVLELSHSAFHRLTDLAEQTRDGWFQSTGGSPSDDSYAIQSTIFRLLSPISAFKLLQKKMTFVDLKVDKRVNIEYRLMKRLYISFASDWSISTKKPSLRYDPYKQVTDDERKGFPEIYNRQGIKAGNLDTLANALIIEKPSEDPRPMDFAEFQKAYGSNEGGIFCSIRAIFLNFNPRTSPVLWRILIAQAHIYQALIRTYSLEDVSDEKLKVLQMMSDVEREKFDWRQEKEKITFPSSKVFEEPFEAVEAYLREHLGELFKKQ